MNIKSVRKSKGLTQKELAEKSNVSFSMISKLESGEKKNPSFETLTKIANALEVSINELLDHNEAAKLYLNNVSNKINEFSSKHSWSLGIIKELGYFTINGVSDSLDEPNTRGIYIMHKGKRKYISESDIYNIEKSILKYGKFILDDILKEGE